MSYLFGTTSNGIFIFLDILFWNSFSALTAYFFYAIFYEPIWDMIGYDWPYLLIYLSLCWFSVLFETLATKKKHMIAVCVLTAFLFSLSVFISLVLSTTSLIDFSQSNNFMYGLYLAFFASIWNFVRFAFQINLIRWIKSTNGHSIPKTLNGYQSI